MKVIIGPPPNYAEILAAFPHVEKRKVHFCYGDKIFTTNGAQLDPSLIDHEGVHAKQQRAIGIKQWWDRYLVDVQFRFEQELEAHIVEYDWYDGKPRRERQFYLRQIARRLAGPLYGNLVTTHEAKHLITRGKLALVESETR